MKHIVKIFSCPRKSIFCRNDSAMARYNCLWPQQLQLTKKRRKRVENESFPSEIDDASITPPIPDGSVHAISQGLNLKMVKFL